MIRFHSFGSMMTFGIAWDSSAVAGPIAIGPATARIRPGGSAEQLGADLAAVDDLDGAVAGGHQLLVGDDAELVIDGGGQVLGADRVALGLAGGGVAGAVDVALLDPAAGQDHAEDLGPVVA